MLKIPNLAHIHPFTIVAEDGRRLGTVVRQAEQLSIYDAGETLLGTCDDWFEALQLFPVPARVRIADAELCKYAEHAWRTSYHRGMGELAVAQQVLDWTGCSTTRAVAAVVQTRPPTKGVH